MNQQRHQHRHQQGNQQKNQSSAPKQTEQVHPPAANIPTQTQIYDNLRRIGELEDRKKSWNEPWKRSASCLRPP